MNIIMGCIHFLIFITLYFKIISAVLNDDVNYYEELIKKNIAISNAYQAPTIYSEFQLNDQNPEPIEYGSYDFIIIGAGTAGSLLANKLSEVNSWRILVIEAGGYENNFTDIPSVASYLYNSEYNWALKTTVQNTGCPVPGVAESEVDQIRGKAVGGSTVLNGNVYARGSPSDYDKWADKGLPNWSFENVLPYFKRFENASALSGIDLNYHGLEGPLILENHKNTSCLSETFIESLKSFGYSVVDYNGENPIGVGYVQRSTYNGRRFSARKAFLRPIEDRPNLNVQIKGLVTRILIENNTAMGVEFIYGHKKYTAFANIEVILSAGSLQSPQILLLSGIGPSSELSKHNVPIVADLPVGLNLQDQYTAGLSVTTNVTSPLTIKDTIAQYLNSYGPLTSAVGIELITFCNTSRGPVEFIFGITNSISLVNGSLIYDAATATSISIFSILLHPKSVGTIRLSSSDPLQFPLINPNYLDNEDDVETLVEGLELLSEVMENELFQKFNASIVVDPECESFTFKSKDYWRCVVRCSGGTGSHPLGSCNMGVDAVDSVVNERLSVHGIEKLRVVDASVVPVTLTGHLFATAYLIGEKAAEIIKEDYEIF